MTSVVRNRQELMACLYSASGGNISRVLACICAYSPADEAGCESHVAASIPALVHTRLLQDLKLNLQVCCRDTHSNLDDLALSEGNLIVLDVAAGKQNIYCRNASNDRILPYDTLAEDIRTVVMEMLHVEMRPLIKNNQFGGSEEYCFVRVSPAGVELYQQPSQIMGATEPRFKGSVQEFALDLPDEIAQQMKNSSFTCPNCGKSCAVCSIKCNNCGTSLEGVPISATENVLMAFVYGISRGAKIPLNLSLRREDSTTLVYDDLLARSPCHLNAIPTDVHLSDWRWLLVRPEAGHALLRRLADACWSAVEEQFWGNAAWQSSVLRPGAVASASEFKSHAIIGVNSVPSQYQLHLHYIMPPLLPESYHLLLRGDRFTLNRWLPFEYVEAALQCLQAKGGLPDAPTMEMDQIFNAIESFGGPNYAKSFAAALRNYAASHETLANWQADCFEQVAIVTPEDSKPYEICTLTKLPAHEEHRDDRSWYAGIAVPDANLKSTNKMDKDLLQSYGRPYNSKGSPAPVSYYSFAKSPGEVMSEKAWSLL